MAPPVQSSFLSQDDVARVWSVLREVPDPEIPVLSVVNLGIVRAVRQEGESLLVDITPTYSGCPATEVIGFEIQKALADAGFAQARINTVLSPAWTTDWIDEEGREKLRAYGIAPPVEGSHSKKTLLGEDPQVPCPLCGSLDTQLVSPFGSTPCKAHYKCRSCLEPFDYFKCL